MRILFFTWPAILRRYADVVTNLVTEGHEVVVASPVHMARNLPRSLRALPLIQAIAYDEASDPAFGRAIGVLRNTRDYLWYLSPTQQVASFNRRKALDRLVHRATGEDRRPDPSWPDPVLQLDLDAQSALDAALAGLEQLIPPDSGLLDLMRRYRPAVVLVSPLVKQDLQQAEVVKAARALGVPT